MREQINFPPIIPSQRIVAHEVSSGHNLQGTRTGYGPWTCVSASGFVWLISVKVVVGLGTALSHIVI